jgi:hypothetical protein
MKHVMVVDDEAMDMPRPLGLRRRYTSMQSFPLLALNLFLFALLNLASSSPEHAWYKAHLFSIGQMSGDTWQVSGGDLFLMLSLTMLFVEVVRSTRSNGDSITNHALTALVFIASMILFMTRPGYGNSTFFLFLGMTLIDFMAGFMITAACARRDTMFSPMADG